MTVNWGAILLNTERFVVAVAALAALFPLYQFWNERDDRALDRHATFVAAYDLCENRFPEVIDAELVVSDDWEVVAEQFLNSIEKYETDLVRAGGAVSPFSDRIAIACGYVFGLNESDLLFPELVDLVFEKHDFEGTE